MKKSIISESRFSKRNQILTLFAGAMAFAALSVLFAGCCGKDVREEKAAASASSAALADDAFSEPRKAVEAFIEVESAARAAERNEAAAKKKQLLTGDAAKGLDEVREKGREYVARADMTGRERAEVLTKKINYYIGAQTGRPERNGEYSERKFILRLEDGKWKIENILERRRGPDEFDGFVPRWNPALR